MDSRADPEVVDLIETVRDLPAAAGLFDERGRVVHANARAHGLVERHLHASMPEDLAAGYAIFHLDGRRYAHEEWPVSRSLAHGEVVVDEEYFHALPDGDRLVVRASAAPVRDAGGAIVGALLIMIDITVGEEPSERLRFLEGVLEGVPDAIVGIDADHRVNLWNPAAQRLYGHAAEAAIGRPAHELGLITGDASAAGPTRTEFTARHKDGGTVEVETVETAIAGDDGEILGQIGVHRDPAERRRRLLACIAEGSNDFVGIARLDGTAIWLNEAGRRMVGLVDADITQTSVLEYFAEEERELLRDTLLPHLRERGRWPAETELHLRHWETGELIPVLWDAFRIDDPETGAPLAMATVTRNVAELKRTQRELESSARRQAILASLGVQTLGEPEPRAVGDAAVRAVAEALRVELVAAAESRQAGGAVIRSGVGWDPGVVGGVSTVLGKDSPLSYTARTRDGAAVEDIGADERFDRCSLLLAHGVRSALTVGITGLHVPFGVLGVFTRSHRMFTEEERSFVQSVANVVAAACERAWYEDRLDTVRDAERARLARDLHDDVLQQLAAVGASSGSGTAPSEHDDLSRRLALVSRHLRAAIYDLSLDVEEDRPLPERLHRLVEQQTSLAEGTDIRAAVADSTPDVTGRRGNEVLRIVREMLTNARSHAEATSIRLTAEGAGPVLEIVVTDDGKGFDPDATRSSARFTGLRAMRERAELLPADLVVRSVPGAGTTVRLGLTLADEEPGARSPTQDAPKSP